MHILSNTLCPLTRRMWDSRPSDKLFNYMSESMSEQTLDQVGVSQGSHVVRRTTLRRSRSKKEDKVTPCDCFIVDIPYYFNRLNIKRMHMIILFIKVRSYLTRKLTLKSIR